MELLRRITLIFINAVIAALLLIRAKVDPPKPPDPVGWRFL